MDETFHLFIQSMTSFCFHATFLYLTVIICFWKRTNLFISAFSSPNPEVIAAATCNEINMTASKTFLVLQKTLPASRPHWVGDGFHVFPVFSNLAFTNYISPWLMFDYGAPKHFDPTTRQLGVGQHPHRGFETITIAFQGEVEHSDSTGRGGVIGPGDVQWMTAGRGIIHEEYHSRKFAKTGGTFEMCQLWLNLPAKYKMTAPRYQPILNKDIPSVDILDNGTCTASVRVIAGNVLGVTGPANVFSPVELLDVTFTPSSANKSIEIDLPVGHTVIVFVRRGGVSIDNGENQQILGPQAVAIMGSKDKGDSWATLRLTATANDSAVMVLGGEPINEPIAARGPFVMNTNDELYQANQDFYSGRMGQ
jgi:redox-sensitive bicupin YhaK (pirin superfamily)